MLRLRFALLVAVVAVTAHDVTYLVGHGVDGYPAALGATGHDGHWLPMVIGVAGLLLAAAAVAAARWRRLRRQLAEFAGDATRHRIGPILPGTLHLAAPLERMQPMRRIAPILLAGSLVLLPTLVLAHTDLTGSDPVDGSTITEAPEEVVLTFEGEVDDSASFTVLDPDGEEVGSGTLDLDVADRNVLRGEVEVAATGVYTVVWSILGDDGHEVEGEVTFTYDPEGEASTPDTSLPVGTGSPATLIGELLIALAVTIPVRRALAVRS